ncbi:MAG: peptidoglycan-binding protein [Acidobacteria bacterium]|nr:peptidoglycan-binding protein [Acidobacteriota bacterium]
MQPGRMLCSALLLAIAVTPCVAMTHSRRGPTSPGRNSAAKHTKAAVKRSSGQRSIDDARASEIQAALVKSGYMKDASGHWDAATESAMQKYQADNGWQTKLMPDSRAIIKLGLGGSSKPVSPMSGAGSVAPASGLAETASASTFAQQ